MDDQQTLQTLQTLTENRTKVIAQQTANVERVQQLRSERARLTLDEEDEDTTALDEIDDELCVLEKNIANNPSLVAEIDKQIGAEKTAIANEQRKQNYQRATKLADEIIATSESYIEGLRSLVQINRQHRDLHDQYRALVKEIKCNPLDEQAQSKPFCFPSEQTLDLVSGFAEAEFKGQRIAHLYRPPDGRLRI